MNIYDQYVDLLVNKKIVDKNFIKLYLENYIDKNNIVLSYNGVNFKDESNFNKFNINYAAYYDLESKEINIQYEKLINYFKNQEINELKDAININNRIIEHLIHECIHAKQQENIDNQSLESLIFRYCYEYIPKELSKKQFYQYYHDILPIEYNANVEAFFDIANTCDEIEKRLKDIKFKKQGLLLQNIIMDKGYTIDKKYRLSPTEKLFNITQNHENIRLLKMCKEYRLMSEEDRVKKGMPINSKTKQKILELDNENIDIFNYFQR